MNPGPQDHPGKGSSGENHSDNGSFFNKARNGEPNTASNRIEIPSISLPKGGGALKGIDEKFSVNISSGTLSFQVPLPLSGSRSDFMPSLLLSYNSGAGNGIFGLGWSLDLPSIQRRTDKKLPTYKDADDTDVFILSGAEDLVPALKKSGSGEWERDEFTEEEDHLFVKRYRPRKEEAFARIEKITASGTTYWKVTSKENVVTYYGISSDGRIADPGDPARVFRWLPELSFDDKGNCIQYEYAAENLLQVPSMLHEKNRMDGNANFMNRHLKRIRYGNTHPYDASPSTPYIPSFPEDPGYLFEAVLDYGDHLEPAALSASGESCLPSIQKPWDCRKDPFSDYRSGFELRTYRLCKSILFFHYFKELNDGIHPGPCLVKSVDFQYRYSSQDPAATGLEEADYMLSLTQYGYARNASGSYDRKGLPPMEFTYQEMEWNKELKIVSEEDTTHAPAGLSENYHWIDLWSEGIAGVLTEQSGGWFYKSNLGHGEFSKALPVIPKPSVNGLSTGTLYIQDLEANGKKYAVSYEGTLKGYYEISDSQEWKPFQPFQETVLLDLKDPNLKMMDLDGDGKADLILSEDDVFTWYRSKGVSGYDAPELVHKPWDEEKGPAIVFSDAKKSIFLADMNGDGMADIVRIRNGEICYWPNLGYGRFGAKVSMSNAPVFDTPDLFNPSYLHLADISGTGATDLLYLGKNTCCAWINQSGNGWSELQELEAFPETAHPVQLSVLDFTGNGTASIVWSSPLPQHRSAPLRYVDLMNGRKPYILSGYKNNFGKETCIEYKSSSAYYLEDKKKGNTWATRLPFPVHCVSKVSIRDVVSNAYFIREYSYHHGYYDHGEREFCGFGRVEQKDSEDFDHFVRNQAANIIDEKIHQTPALTKSWFHTGAFLQQASMLHQFSGEYFKNPQEYHLPEPVISEPMSTAEWMEASRAFKGTLLRQEIYALDNTDKAAIPFSVTAHNADIRRVQPGQDNRHAVFLVQERESLIHHYERNLLSPRVSHILNLEKDELGNVLMKAEVAYGREVPAADLPSVLSDAIQEDIHREQSKRQIVIHLSEYTKDVIDRFSYRLRLPCIQKSYELTNVMPAGKCFGLQELRDACNEAAAIGFEEEPGAGKHKRLLKHKRVLFWNSDLSAPLPLGSMSAQGMPYESYQLSFTASLFDRLFHEKISSPAERNALLSEGQYITSAQYKTSHLFPSSDPDEEWWVRSGYALYPPNPRNHFYMPSEIRNALNVPTKLRYDPDYHLFLREAEDALGNVIAVARFNYRVLQPELLRDMNGNESEVRYDLLGIVAGTAMKGKGNEADDFSDFRTELTEAEISAFFSDPLALGAVHLGHASERFIYNLNELPVSVATVSRETHWKDTLDPDTGMPSFSSRLFYSFEYADGMGNTAMKKTQAEPGPAQKLVKHSDGTYHVETIDTSLGSPPALRWVGTGRTVFNNKGNPVKKYEPYFSTTHLYEQAPELAEAGVSPVLYYDALGREIRVNYPDGTFSRVEFDNWCKKSFDQNDTVLEPGCSWYQERLSGSLASDPLEREVALKTAVHAGTPEVEIVNSLGKEYYRFRHNKFRQRDPETIAEALSVSKTETDIEGNPVRVFDGNENLVMEYKYDMAGNAVLLNGMDGGKRWLLNDVAGRQMYLWDGMGRKFFTSYDDLDRPEAQRVFSAEYPEGILFERSVYGEGKPGDKEHNLRGKIWKHYDGAGMIVNSRYDFKDNLLETTRTFTVNYTNIPDWDNELPLQPLSYPTVTLYDAMSRVTELRTPDGSITRKGYSEANALKEVKVMVKGGAEKTFVKNITHNAKGQREKIEYSQDGTETLVTTHYTYDPLTYRLKQIRTLRAADHALLQDLNYTSDPVGNIVHISDGAWQDLFFNNQHVTPSCDYEYDALYRLVYANGREHAGGNRPVDASDEFRMDLPLRADGNAMQNYEQQYQYDAAGNMLSMKHKAGVGGLTNRWTRIFSYHTHHPDPAQRNNRLSSATVGSSTDTYAFDDHGNIRSMPHLPSMDWDFKNQLRGVDLSGGGKAYYIYDSSGQRLRKVVEKPDNTTEERLYLGSVEFYQKYRRNEAGENTGIQLQRESLHVMDDVSRIALVETPTLLPSGSNESQVVRFQMSNHLGTAALELDETGHIISYEEYYPYGSTAFQSSDKAFKIAAKRYRYTSKERDEESGLYYHGARYYAPWLAGWISLDPHFENYIHLSPYHYSMNNPVKYTDPDGMDVFLYFQGGISGDGPVPNTTSDEPAGSTVRSIQTGATQAGVQVDTQIIAPGLTDEPSVNQALDFIRAHYEPGERVVIYGYSHGGIIAMEVARRLQAMNIEVDLLIVVDAAYGPTSGSIDRNIPGNVRTAYNIYQTTPSRIRSRGDAATAADPRHTQLTNRDMTSATVTHGNIDDAAAPEVVRQVTERLRQPYTARIQPSFTFPRPTPGVPYCTYNHHQTVERPPRFPSLLAPGRERGHGSIPGRTVTDPYLRPPTMTPQDIERIRQWLQAEQRDRARPAP